MRSVTAHMLVGTRSEEGGAIKPSALLYFSEEEPPVWHLHSVVAKEEKEISWITRNERALEDGLLLVGLHLLRDPELLRLAGEAEIAKGESVDPEALFGAHFLGKMHERCQQLSGELSIVFTIHEGSMLAGSLRILEDYSFNLELCTSRTLHQTSVRI